ncbi:GDSL-type esterase/lipase family protein [Rhodoferax antarcticus]|uniref:GDSL-type esterase/lipase family protein n=1 Tax=Rhodoferax antarcticus TaxID=81479 RepID=UPI000950080F|nr:GDSL-type esterase/lipase family protein [Rhodoferax antarcticus]APW47025.1 GDSL family lipase [Rhodoferax antarcticus]
MKPRRPPVLLALSVIAALAVLGESGRVAWRISQSAELARQSEPFQASPTQPVATLLVAGDSTGVGTGASSPAQSLAGLIAIDHPLLQIVNRAKDGAKFADIARQLEALGDQRFDAILVLGGGNDVIRFTGHKALSQAVVRTAQLASTHGKLVVIMPSGNVGNAPFFFPPLSWLMAQRSRQLHRLVRETAADNGALYVNLYKEKAEDPFAQRPVELNASDGLHPSDAGYRVWYSELNAQADFSNRLAARGR